jgi:curved DNA-binding protein CbpA
MQKVHTHYDNLKVARNAPLEVIRAAYRTLSQKYHPDRNPGDDEAARIMKIINQSYGVLSAQDLRNAHDAWIADQEAFVEVRVDRSGEQSASAQRQSTSTTPELRGDRKMWTHFRKWFWLYFCILFVGFLSLVGDKSDTAPAATKPYEQATSAPLPPKYERPAVSPNGKPWPNSASYIAGAARLRNDGLSRLTVDNTRNASDIHGKLVAVDNPVDSPVREFFIPAGQKFEITRIRAGSYDVRYRDLETGALSKSEQFILTERATQNGRQFSNITMTLYKVTDGNMQTFRIQEGEF